MTTKNRSELKSITVSYRTIGGLAELQVQYHSADRTVISGPCARDEVAECFERIQQMITTELSRLHPIT